MKWLNVALARIRGLVRREAVLRDVDEELRLHIELETEANVRRGMSEADARREALRSFGNVSLIKDTAHDVRGGGLLDSIWQDLRFGARMLLKHRAFTASAVATLALGIGANSAIFTVFNTMLLRPLPFKDPDQIVMVYGRSTVGGDRNNRETQSFADYQDFRERSRSFSTLAAYSWTSGPLAHSQEAQLLRGVAVTSEIFDLLGVRPLLGRAYTPADHQEGAPYIIVISHGLWQRAFGGDRNILGRQINLSGRNFTVVGVMPPGWKFPVEDERIDYLAPFEYQPVPVLNNRGAHFARIIGRLKPGVSIREAEAETSAIATHLAAQYPSTNAKYVATAVVTLHSDVVSDVRPALLILLAAVTLVLLIACANVANLLLARGASRGRELAIRTSLGATRARIVRQMLCESLLIAVLGGSAGLVLAWWSLDLVNAIRPPSLPHLGEIRVNALVAAYTYGLAIACTLFFGLVPALQVSRPSVHEILQQAAKGSTGSLHSSRSRSLLVISQVAVSLLLLTCAGLLLKSFSNLRAANPGFDAARTVRTSIPLPRVRYTDIDQQIRTYHQIFQKISAIPVIESAGGINPLPLTDTDISSSFIASGMIEQGPGTHPNAGDLIVTGDYFQAMQIPVLVGRTFLPTDGRESAPVIVVNEVFARKFFAGRDPLDQWIRIDPAEGKAPLVRRVIGVIGDTRHASLAANPEPQFYVPLSQEVVRTDPLSVVLRTRAFTSLPGLRDAVKHAVWEVDKDLFVAEFQPMKELISVQLAQPRFNLLLLGVFAGVALILAAIGIYGVIAYSVSQRTREIGIRMALGAQRSQMLAMILQQSLMLVLIGIVSGVIVSLGATRVIASLLFGVGVNDISTYAAVITLLGAAAFLASYIPARRAMRVDPMVALRYE